MTAGRRALVTGAGKRIGRAIALDLAKRGFDVAVHYATSSAGADEVAAEISAAGRKAVTLAADLTDEAQSQRLFPEAVKALGGPITCLVNNASLFEYDNFASSTRRHWDRNIESNLRAPFVLTQAMAGQGLEAEPDSNGEPAASGLIANVIDQRVRKLTPQYASYTIAKMGLWAMTQTAARALAPAIRVNGIGPGPTLRAEGQSEEGYRAQRSATVLGRGSNPEDICAALGFLLEAPSVTGQLICADGGQHLGWQTPDVIGVD